MKTVLVLSILILSGCTINRPFIQTTGFPLGPKEDPIATTTGKSSAKYFLFFGPFGDNSTSNAIQNALANTKGDAITNMVAERSVFLIFPFYAKVTTSVTGTVINYKDSPNFIGYIRPKETDISFEGYFEYREKATSKDHAPQKVMGYEEWVKERTSPRDPKK